IQLVVGDRAVPDDQGTLVVDRPEEVQARAIIVVTDLVAGDRDVIECQVALVPDGVVGRPGECQPGDGRRDAGVDGEGRGAAGLVVVPAGAGERHDRIPYRIDIARHGDIPNQGKRAAQGDRAAQVRGELDDVAGRGGGDLAAQRSVARGARVVQVGHG